MAEQLQTKAKDNEVGGRGSCRAADRAMTPSKLPQRQQLPHGVEEFFNQPTILFVTVCTKDRIPWLLQDNLPQLLREVWTEATAWAIGRYVIMPDHVHFFCSPAQTEISLEAWITYWKSQFSKKHQLPNCRWQTEHWDTRMRTHQQYEEKWMYVQRNPEWHGLVQLAEDWLWQGEIYELRWS